MLDEVFIGHGQHSARSRRWVVYRPDHAWLGKHIVILNEEEMHHEADHLARREVLTGRLIGKLGEAPDQFLKDKPHLMAIHLTRAEVDAREALGDLIEQ